VATYFFDTNALIKLYVFDATSYWAIGIEAQRKPQHRIIVSEIVRVEIPSALYKISRIDLNVDPSMIDLGIRRFQRQLSADTSYRKSRFLVATLNEAVFQQAEALLEKYRLGRPKALHSLDALHLTSAIVARNALSATARSDMYFVSADKQLRGCAQSEGFAILDPNNPPPA
jgi:predicted nucleic acid-binding protein